MKNDNSHVSLKSMFFQTAHAHMSLLTYPWSRTMSLGICFPPARITGGFPQRSSCKWNFKHTHCFYPSCWCWCCRWVFSSGLKSRVLWAPTISREWPPHRNMNFQEAQPCPAQFCDWSNMTQTCSFTQDFPSWTMALFLPLGRWFPSVWEMAYPQVCFEMSDILLRNHRGSVLCSSSWRLYCCCCCCYYS